MRAATPTNVLPTDAPVSPPPSALFEPIRIGTATSRNRIAKSATSETMADPDGGVTDAYVSFYETVAAGGTGLVITGNVFAQASGRSTPGQAGIESDDRIPGWTRFADAVHRHGSLAFAQINHAGRQVMPAAIGLPEAVSASDVREKLMWTRPRPMNPDEIDEATTAFAEGARRAREAGFDGVQIHAGHGYLVSQFLSPYTNRRRDAYGGSLPARMRFLLETFRKTRDRVGQDFPVIVKLNAEDRVPLVTGLTLAESLEVAHVLEEEGLDGIELTCGMYESGLPMIRGDLPIPTLLTRGLGPRLPRIHRIGAWFMYPFLKRAFAHREGFNLPYARAFRERVRLPLLCVGGFQHGATMEAALRERACDMVSLARALIADPELPNKIRDGRPVDECNRCNRCIARAGVWPVGCYRDEV